MNLYYNDIIATVRSKMNLRQPFTLFNVTLELRRLGHHVHHNAIKEDIRRVVTSTSQGHIYEETLVNGPKGVCRLYHPSGYDVTEFRFDEDDSFIPTPVTNGDATNPTTTYVEGYDSRNRLTIPAHVVKVVAKPWLWVCVSVQPNKIVITTDPTCSSPRSYTVEESGILRISGRWVKEAFGSLCKVRFGIVRDEIHILKA